MNPVPSKLECDMLVAVLHDMQLTHTDLKPENILFVNSDSELEYDPKSVSGLHCHHITYAYCTTLRCYFIEELFVDR